MLTALDLAGIPLESKDRTEDDPIVLAGGHAAFNPEPIADFIDAAVIGDGEQAVLDMTRIIREWKAEGRPGGREEVLFRLAKTGGCTSRRSTTSSTSPTAVSPVSSPTGRACRGGCPSTVTGPDEWPYPKQPLVPPGRRRSTSACRWRSSAAAPAAAASAGGHDHPPGP